jgi:hypothetical protein
MQPSQSLAVCTVCWLQLPTSCVYWGSLYRRLTSDQINIHNQCCGSASLCLRIRIRLLTLYRKDPDPYPAPHQSDVILRPLVHNSFDFNAYPDPDFRSDTYLDPDPASQNYLDPFGSGSESSTLCIQLRYSLINARDSERYTLKNPPASSGCKLLCNKDPTKLIF